MSERHPDRYEVAPGCYIVSSRGLSRSGSMADTVRAIVEEADARYERERARLAATTCAPARGRCGR